MWCLCALILWGASSLTARVRGPRLTTWELLRDERLSQSGWPDARQRWQEERNEAEATVRQAKEKIMRELMAPGEVTAYEAALSTYLAEAAAWSEYEERLGWFEKEHEEWNIRHSPNEGWFGDQWVDYNMYNKNEPPPSPPSRPGFPRPEPPYLEDYVDTAKAEAVFEVRRDSGELTVPDLSRLPDEPPMPPDPLGKPKPMPQSDRWLDQAETAFAVFCVSLLALVLIGAIGATLLPT